jgi:hypothetical protein
MAKDTVTISSGKSIERSGSREIDDFVHLARALATTKGAAKGRLVLALDATMSRQPTWDMACRLQGEMFDAVGKSGGLEVQLAYFRGLSECRASGFVRDTASLKDLMTRIDCRAGNTQIGKILAHALKETARHKVDALVYIGDAMEEDIDALAEQAGRLGLRGVPVFVFQEGDNPVAEAGLKEIARLSKGMWFRFDRASAGKLAKLLSSVAVFATGGLKALQARNHPEDRLLIEHMRGGTPR